MMRPLNKNLPGHVAGFTLVELLLAITLMSILLGLTYTGLRAATRSSERGEKMLAAGGELRAAHQFMRRQLNQMLPLPFALEEGAEETRVVFEGDESHIQYVAPMPGYLGTGGPQVQLVVIANDNDGDVVLQFANALLQEFEQEDLFERDPVILLENVSSASFEFLGADEEGESTGWVSRWDQPEILPRAVRLSLEFSEESNLRWPELVAGVRIDELAVNGGGGRRGTSNSTYQKSIQDLIKGKGKKN
jgi:general secretion pathway protein J